MALVVLPPLASTLPAAVLAPPVDLRLGGEVLSAAAAAVAAADLDETELGVLLGVPLSPPPGELHVEEGDEAASRRRASSRRAIVFLRFFLSDFLT